MDVVDTKKLETAILYLQRITEGRNPVNNMPAEEDSVINNPNVVRCMFFVKEVLEELKENDGYIGRRPRERKKTNDDKAPFPLEVLENYEYTGDKSLTKFVDQLNHLTTMKGYKKLSFNLIRAWLLRNGYLAKEETEGSDETQTVVTDKGKEIGITSEICKDYGDREFLYVKYGEDAQKFIVSNLESILMK